MSKELLIQENGIAVRAEIDAQITTAKAYPRNPKKSVEYAEMLATLDEETAQSCMYALPRKDKNGNKIEIKGASIRLAEIMMNAWEHIHCATRIVENDGKHITAEAVAWDLQQNVKVVMQNKVSIIFGQKDGKGGYTANADMQTTLSNAAAAKALRNAIFKVIPKAFVDTVYKKAIEFSIGDSKTLATKITNAVNKLVKMGLNKEEMLQYFGHTTLNEFTSEDYASLIGIGTALKEGMIKPEDVFSLEKNENESAADKLNDLIASKKSPKLELSVNAETGEVLNDLPY